MSPRLDESTKLKAGLDAGPALEALARSLVGRSALTEAGDHVRRAMLGEALRRTRGNYTRAAALLGVKRQAVQQMVTRLNLLARYERPAMQVQARGR